MKRTFKDDLILGLFIAAILYSLFSTYMVFTLRNEIDYLVDSNNEKLELLIEKNEAINDLKVQLSNTPK